MKRSSRIYVLAILLAGPLALTGCGGSAYREATGNKGPGGDAGGVGNTPGVITGGTNPGDTTTPGDFIPAAQFNFSITGSGATTATTVPNPSFTTGVLNTDNMLRVKLTPGPAGSVNTNTGSNSSANYYCASYSVQLLDQYGNTIGSPVQSAAMTVNGGGGPCAQGAADQTIDLSDRLGQGHRAVKIKVSGARYDIYCQWLQNGLMPIPFPWTYQQAYATYCGAQLYPALPMHTMTGRVEIQTN